MGNKKPNRVNVPKSVRFEVFKRDKFTCQYCGESAPNVILEVDHIVPVSKGGSNDIMNLITSCRDCNRGKSAKELSDNTAVAIQKRQLDTIQERREQLEMMIQWKRALEEETTIEVEAINVIFENNTERSLSDAGKQDIAKLIRRFGFNEVYTACEISIDRYYKGTSWSWDNAFKKIGGICYNRKHGITQKARSKDRDV